MPCDKGFLLMLKSNGLAEGDQELREKLIKAFLNSFIELEAIPGKIVFSGTGIFLTTEGSPLIDIIRKFESAGTQILSCSTCLDHYGRKDKLIIGQATTMKETVAAMLTMPKVMAP
jgi:selenium metabolism protein YedF